MLYDIDRIKLKQRLITLIRDNEWTMSYVTDETGLARLTLEKFFKEMKVSDMTIIKLDNFAKRYEEGSSARWPKFKLKPTSIPLVPEKE